MNSTVIGALLRQRSTPTNLRIDTPQPPARGEFGKLSAPRPASPPTCTTCKPIPFPSSSCLPNATDPAKPVRSRTVEDALRHVAPAFARVGPPDPRVNAFGDVDFRLQALLTSRKKTDTPPTRVKPLPMVVLRRAHHWSMDLPTHPATQAAGDCLLLAYFFLLRPGGYSGAPLSAAGDLFRVQDVGAWIGHRRLDLLRCPVDDLLPYAQRKSMVCFIFAARVGR